MATTWYVSNAALNNYVLGSDSNAGTSPTTAFLTINHAYSSASSGDTIIINPTSNSYASANNPYLETTSVTLTINKTITILGDQNFVSNVSPLALAVVQSTGSTTVFQSNGATIQITDVVADVQNTASKHAWRGNGGTTTDIITWTRFRPVNNISTTYTFGNFGSNSQLTADRITFDPSNVLYADGFFTLGSLVSFTIKGGVYAAPSSASHAPTFYWQGGTITTFTIENDVNGVAPQVSGDTEFLKPGITGTFNATACYLNNAFVFIDFAAQSASQVTTALNVTGITCIGGALSNTGGPFIINVNEGITLGTIANNYIDTTNGGYSTGGMCLDLHNGTGSPLIYGNTLIYNGQNHTFQLGCDGYTVDSSNTATSTGGQKLGDASGDTYVGFSFPTSATSVTGHSSYLAEVIVQIETVGSPSGNITAYLYANSGGAPTGSALATSTVVPTSQLSSSYQQFAFEFLTPYQMTPATEYWMVFEYSGTSSASNYVNMSQNTTTTTGSIVTSANGSSWTANTGNQLLFYLNTGTYGITDARVYNNTVIGLQQPTSTIIHGLAMGAQIRGWLYDNRVYGCALGCLFKENKGATATNPALVFNNLVYELYGGFEGVGPLITKASTYVYFLNNIAISGTSNTGATVVITPDQNSTYTPVNAQQCSYIFVENNILINMGSSATTNFVYSIYNNYINIAPTNITINNNCVYAPNGAIIGILGISSNVGVPVTSYSTWAAWQTAGYDANGVNANPLLPTLVMAQPALPVTTATALAYAQQFIPANTSPAKGAGVNTNGLVTTDYLGNPYSVIPDIGAFSITYNSQQALLSNQNVFNPFINNRDYVGITGATATQIFSPLQEIITTSTSITLPPGANNNFLVLANTSGGNLTVTLPPTTTSNGTIVAVENISSGGNTLTVAANSADTIQGSATKTTTTQYAKIGPYQAYATNTEWY